MTETIIKLKIWRTHKHLYFMDYQRYIKDLIHSYYYDLQFLVLIPANAICRNMLILSYNSKFKNVSLILGH